MTNNSRVRNADSLLNFIARSPYHHLHERLARTQRDACQLLQDISNGVTRRRESHDRQRGSLCGILEEFFRLLYRDGALDAIVAARILDARRVMQQSMRAQSDRRTTGRDGVSNVVASDTSSNQDDESDTRMRTRLVTRRSYSAAELVALRQRAADRVGSSTIPAELLPQTLNQPTTVADVSRNNELHRRAGTAASTFVPDDARSRDHRIPDHVRSVEEFRGHTSSRVTVPVLRCNNAPGVVQYWLRSDENPHLATFDWRSGARQQFLAYPYEASRSGSLGGIRVDLNAWLCCGLDLHQLDRLVLFEIDKAVRQDVISEHLSETFWNEWNRCDRMTWGQSGAEWYEDL